MRKKIYFLICLPVCRSTSSFIHFPIVKHDEKSKCSRENVFSHADIDRRLVSGHRSIIDLSMRATRNHC